MALEKVCREWGEGKEGSFLWDVWFVVVVIVVVVVVQFYLFIALSAGHGRDQCSSSEGKGGGERPSEEVHLRPWQALCHFLVSRAARQSSRYLCESKALFFPLL